jgi:hypothetical protein
VRRKSTEWFEDSKLACNAKGRGSNVRLVVARLSSPPKTKRAVRVMVVGWHTWPAVSRKLVPLAFVLINTNEGTIHAGSATSAGVLLPVR